MVTKINKSNVDSLRNELEAAIRSVCEKHGLTASSLGTIAYTENYFTTGKLTVTVKREELPASDLVGKRYKLGRRTFTIMTDNQDGSVTARTDRGVSYRIPLAQLQSMIQCSF